MKIINEMNRSLEFKTGSLILYDRPALVKGETETSRGSAARECSSHQSIFPSWCLTAVSNAFNLPSSHHLVTRQAKLGGKEGAHLTNSTLRYRRVRGGERETEYAAITPASRGFASRGVIRRKIALFIHVAPFIGGESIADLKLTTSIQQLKLPPGN